MINGQGDRVSYFHTMSAFDHGRGQDNITFTGTVLLTDGKVSRIDAVKYIGHLANALVEHMDEEDVLELLEGNVAGCRNVVGW